MDSYCIAALSGLGQSIKLNAVAEVSSVTASSFQDVCMRDD
ncbi:conserved hypothetical protein [Halomonas sp. 59]|nr:conserved hypothetical protein [Halomonas sp. 156]CAD5281418.1 conserved hypothetical protein [Halomonas sp. 113]CAD5282795.1 conserved hypothetical protein [Halomonas sp. 59]CAD5288956.1 conserved hypothetical protein [Halomonas sp. I3]VXB15918.1 conserved hypothetical protein [Halomonas titanicae]